MAEYDVNPYERRGARTHTGDYRDLGMVMAGGPPVLAGGPPRGLEIDDLQALAFNAMVRGRAEATREIEERHAEDKLAAQRLAWDEGWQAGVPEGRARVLSNFLQSHGPSMRAVDQELRAAIDRVNENPRHVTKQDLAGSVVRAQALVTQLLRGAERAFELQDQDGPQ